MDEWVKYVIPIGMTVISGLGGISVKILWQLTLNVAELNQKMAGIIQELTHNSKRSDRMDSVIDAIDNRVRRMETSPHH